MSLSLVFEWFSSFVSNQPAGSLPPRAFSLGGALTGLEHF